MRRQASSATDDADCPIRTVERSGGARYMYRVDRNNFYREQKNATVYTPPDVSRFLFGLLHHKINKAGVDPRSVRGALDRCLYRFVKRDLKPRVSTFQTRATPRRLYEILSRSRRVKYLRLRLSSPIRLLISTKRRSSLSPSRSGVVPCFQKYGFVRLWNYGELASQWCCLLRMVSA